MPAKGLLLLSVALYIACLAMDSFCLATCSDWPGIGVLIVGALGVPLFGSNLLWLANPALFVAWFFIWQRQGVWASILGGVALALAAAFMLVDSIVASESGMPSRITGLALGYWVWLASIAAACGAAGILTIVPQKSKVKA
jgi:hypothetical protein